MSFDRVYHHINLWEEVAANMWGEVANVQDSLQIAIEFTGDHEAYGAAMLDVVQNWPYSCENALTDSSLNKKAWIGHAAVAYRLGIPEDITRKAWGHLTDEQRLLANKKAERAIQKWSEHYAKSKGILPEMGGPLLL